MKRLHFRHLSSCLDRLVTYFVPQWIAEKRRAEERIAEEARRAREEEERREREERERRAAEELAAQREKEKEKERCVVSFLNLTL